MLDIPLPHFLFPIDVNTFLLHIRLLDVFPLHDLAHFVSSMFLWFNLLTEQQTFITRPLETDPITATSVMHIPWRLAHIVWTIYQLLYVCYELCSSVSILETLQCTNSICNIWRRKNVWRRSIFAWKYSEKIVWKPRMELLKYHLKLYQIEIGVCAIEVWDY